MSTYPAGTVAIATVRGVPGVRVMRIEAMGELTWMSPEPVRDGRVRHDDFRVGDIRPLVVLDLGDYDNRAVTYLRNIARDDLGLERPTPRAKLVCLIADQIEAQTKPPRIPEPGLYGVVKASLNGKATGETDWVHLISGWYRGADDESRPWSALQNPTLIREGLS